MDFMGEILRLDGRRGPKYVGISSEPYNPRKKTALILDRAFDLVSSVPYKVSARWVFYRLLQEGFYSKKSDYKNKWIKASSSARHCFYKDWCPDTLADETRQPIVRGDGEKDPESWFTLVENNLECSLDKWFEQTVYLELWYEARAMSDQFRYYTKYITLRPMGGQPSIPYKWGIAKSLEDAYRCYKNPLVVLYFGDLDPSGETISEVVKRDVRKWCRVPFEFVYCGLTEDQVDLYDIPENPEKPGEFQWEALSDEAAGEIITSFTEQYLHHDAFYEVELREKAVTAWIRTQLKEITGKWKG